MVEIEIDQSIDRRLPSRKRLARKPEHEVEAQIAHAGRPYFVHSLHRLTRRMGAAEPEQFTVVERLHAQTDTGHARLEVPGHAFTRHGLGVGLERDLGIGFKREAVTARVNESFHFDRIEQRRRASPEENSIGRGSIPRAANFAFERVDVASLESGLEQPAIEVAVRTDGPAKGDVKIQTEGGR